MTALQFLRSATIAALGLALGMGIAIAQTAVPINPPNLAGAVGGTLPGEGSVGQSGASSYNIPLAMPPGTAGLAPAISLEYSSQSRMGLMGYGWRITSLSTITRCGKTIAQDGYATAVKLTTEDQFCLDGQRLLIVPASGTHGATAEYRTQVDTLGRIRSSGTNTAIGPDSFTVEAKGGLIYSYGSTADSRIEAAGLAARHTWALSRVQDKRGNFYTYTYSKNAVTGEYFPTQVRYTGNAVSGLQLYNAVNFIYEARPDPWRDYIVGKPFDHTQRLKAVQMRINTLADGSGGTLARDYRITYVTNPVNGRSLVNEISDCDGAGNCLPSTRFTWTQRNAAHANFNATGSGVWGGPVAVYADTAHKNVWNAIAMVDMNGDGKTDFLKSFENGTWQVCYSTGSSFSCQTWTGPNKKMNDVVMGDFNGDGKTDLAYTDFVGGVTSGFVCFNSGSAFSCQSSSTTAISSDVVTDINGDGRSDFGFCYSQGNGSFSCQTLNTGQLGMALEQKAICPEEIIERKNITADFDGDGKTDYLTLQMWSPVCPQGHIQQYYWDLYTTVNGASQVGIVGGQAAGLPQVDQFIGRVQQPGSSVGNFNQDGYADLVLQGLTGQKLYLCSGTGTGFACTVPAVDTTQSDQVVHHVGDFDGDGRADTLHFTLTNQARICQVGGSGSYTCSNWSGAAGPAKMYADFNGDGKTDIGYYNDTTQQWSIGLADGPVPDLLLSVTNGLGHATEFSYSSIGSPSVYTPGAATVYPKKNVDGGSTVVTEKRVANALGGWLTTTYKYGSQRTDQSGRGALGFGTTVIVDQVSGVTTTTTHSQDFPTTGMPLSTSSVSSASVILTSTTNTPASQPTTAGAQCPYISSSTTTTRDLNNALMLTTSEQVNAGGVDAFCNITNSTKTVTGGGETFSSNTVNVYDNLTVPWLIGLLRRSTVTKSATQTGTDTTAPTLAFTNCSSTTLTTTPTPATMTCTLSNNGQSVAKTITYTTAPGTTVAGPANCSANKACGTVKVTTAAGAGTYAGSLTATPTPQGGGATASVSLVVNAASSASLSVSPTSLAFGTVAKSASRELTLTLTNTSSVAATGMLSRSFTYTSGTVSQGQYADGGGTCAATLAPGASCTAIIRYDALCTGGTRNANLTLSGANFPSLVVGLTAATQTSGFCN